MNRKYRHVIVAGNWKMNCDLNETKQLISELKQRVKSCKWCDIILCVPSIAITTAVKCAKGAKFSIAAQNIHHEKKGAFTGEISADMVFSTGAKFVVIGHSERRQYFNETDNMVNLKVKAALAASLRPIICVGETEEQRDKGVTFEHIEQQVKCALYGLDVHEFRKVIIAYEPIWAIGTGKTATAQQANEVAACIRVCLRKLYGARAARTIGILYGGSVTPQNAEEIFAQQDIDGGLIGGASLKAETFHEIILAAK